MGKGTRTHLQELHERWPGFLGDPDSILGIEEVINVGRVDVHQHVLGELEGEKRGGKGIGSAWTSWEKLPQGLTLALGWRGEDLHPPPSIFQP